MFSFVGIVWLSFYIRFAQRAWFFQDDFGFLERFRSSPHLGDAFESGSVIRPLTQNLYWYAGQQLLGSSARAFFFANLCCMLLTAALFARLLIRRSGLIAGLGAALIYFTCTAVALTYVWISNSQHLIPHLLIASFLFVLFRRHDDTSSLSWRRATVLVLILAVAAISNAFALLVVLAVVVDMACRRAPWRRHLPELTVIAVGCVLIAVMYTLTSTVRSGVYSSQYTLDRFLTNGEFYFGSRWMLALWAMSMIAGLVLGVVRRRPLEATLFGLSLALYAPFAVLRYQVYHHYSAMAIVLALLAIWTAAVRLLGDHPNFSVVAAGALSLWALVPLAGGSLHPSAPIRELAERPNGQVARSYVAQLDEIVAHAGWSNQELCFTASAEQEQDDGSIFGPFPHEWWQVGFGSAFSLFAQEHNSYRYVFVNEDATGCDQRLFFSGDGQLTVDS